jgi:chromosomal replication initiation ATPase DnaA
MDKLSEITNLVCSLKGLEPGQLITKSRDMMIVYPRQLIYYFAVGYTKLKPEEIAARVGGKDRSTVIYGFNRIRELNKFDLDVKYDVKAIKGVLKL